MIDLGTASGRQTSIATGVDQDGGVIVGSSASTSSLVNYSDVLDDTIVGDSVATRWTVQHGAQDLNIAAVAASIDLQGDTLLTAQAVSPDGEFIAGLKVPTGSPNLTGATAYILRYCDDVVQAACDAYDAIVADSGGSGGVVGITTPDEQQTSVNGLDDDRFKIMVGTQGFAAPLVGDNSPIGGQSTNGGVYASVGSLAGGVNGRFEAPNGLTLLGGIAGASESYGGVDMTSGLLFAAALRYLQPWQKNISMLAEVGGWYSPSGSYRFTRAYSGGTGIGDTTGTQS